MKICDLRCEYLEMPLAIDELKPRLSWAISSEQSNILQSHYRILVSSDLNTLDKNEGNIWDSGKIASDCSIQIEYNGQKLMPFKRYWWKVLVWTQHSPEPVSSEATWWETGYMNLERWEGKWIGLAEQDNPKMPGAADNVGLPSPYLRKEFTVKKGVVRAKVYGSALGVYELYLNGKKAGNEYFAPGWTDYNVRVNYQVYDITNMLYEGVNCIGAILGDGWYAGNILIVGRHQYGSYPLLFTCVVRLEYEDGTVDIIQTDNTWMGRTGAILYSDMHNGEFYDARKEIIGWALTGAAESEWFPVIVSGQKRRLCAQITPGVQCMQELKPVDMLRRGNNTVIFDMGQNMVGFARLSVKGKSGDSVKMRFGEMLNDDGSLYVENLRTAQQTDTYILKGDGLEVYQPHFTFHGFRYVEVTGYPGEISNDSITGVVLHSALEESGDFECSNPMVNKIFKNAFWGQRGNFFSLPTDCPQRDERSGWTGDGQIFARTACFNMDSAAFFTKWMQDICDAQKDNGAFTDVAPRVLNKDGIDFTGSGTAAWGDAGVIVPWTLYLCYGDKRVIERNIDAMVSWVEYMKANSTELLRPCEGYGDWLSIDADTPKDVMSTAFFAYSTMLVAKMSRIIGRVKLADKYDKLFCDIVKAFQEAYVLSDGRIKGDTQTCYVLALRFGLLHPELRKIAAQHLVRTIEEKNWHLSTGFVGVSYLLPVLSEFGYNHVAYRLILNDTYPSWGYSIKNGATTIWERWNSYTKENGFGDVGMNSFNHYSLGSVVEWMYRYVAGIDTKESQPGYKHLKIQPRPDCSLTHARASYKSIYGKISSEWELNGDEFCLNVEIPANTYADIYLPYSTSELIHVIGSCSFDIPCPQDGYVIYNAVSGRYSFKMKIKV